MGGGESGWIAARADDPDVVFAGSYGGYVSRYDVRTGQERDINAWPDNPMGWAAADLRYRFQWTFPIVLSPTNPAVLYVGAQVLFRTTDEGRHWEVVSPDLTRNDRSKQQSSGGPITKDNTSVEYYGTIFTVAPSSRDSSLIWVGTDDGLVQLTRDGGKTWQDVTPKDVTAGTQISTVDASPLDAATAYVAATRYKLDDFTPYAYVTHDYGKTWRRITTGIPAGHFVRVVRADPVRPGLALCRNRVRRVRLLRRWSELAVLAAEPARRPGTRPDDQGWGPRRRDARALVLDPGRSLIAAAGDARSGRGRPLAVHAERCLARPGVGVRSAAHRPGREEPAGGRAHRFLLPAGSRHGHPRHARDPGRAGFARAPLFHQAPAGG